MRPTTFWQAHLLALVLLVLTAHAIEEWPQWRGPHRDGHAVGFKLPKPWPVELHERWRAEVGIGHSSPIVADGRLYIFTRQGDNEVLACLNPADGKAFWRHTYAAPYEVNPAAATHGKGPRSTPIAAGGRVFTFGISGILSCWDAKSGTLAWRREFSKLFEKTAPIYGAAMSPAVDQDKCIVHVGGEGKGALLALNVENGETIWSCNEDGPGYTSPVIATIDDVRQVITQSQRACLGVDVEDGKLLWKIPFATEFEQNSVTPLVLDESVVFSGLNKGIECYRIGEQDDEWETDKVWENKQVSLYMSSPVADGDRLFGFSHRQKGQLFALDLTTGKTLWTGDGRLGDNAAIVQSGKVLWALTTTGDLILFQADDKQFHQLARYKVAETPTWAHPLLLPGGVLIKEESKLILWQFRKPG